MTHRGPFQPLLFCDSVIRWMRTILKRNRSSGSRIVAWTSPPSTHTKSPCLLASTPVLKVELKELGLFTGV